MPKSRSKKGTKCMACGSVIVESTYQMRAADEAHTSVWSCRNCPFQADKLTGCPCANLLPISETSALAYTLRVRVISVPSRYTVQGYDPNLTMTCDVTNTGRNGHTIGMIYHRGPLRDRVCTLLTKV